jgi:VIT1/CCC1 family predicted Fe2+/Mn2+ transporter
MTEHITGAELVHTPAARSIREIVFGVNDGLVSITGLVVGVTSSHMGSHQIVIAGLAAIAAATVAMGLGAYLSTAAQNEYFQSEWDREWREVHEVPDEERREVETILREMGFDPEEATHFTRRLMADKRRWVDFMMKEELGIVMDRDSPWKSAGIMALAVIAGSLPPILPYLLIPHPQVALKWAIGLAFATAFGLGWTKAAVARGVWWKSGIQFVAVAAAATVVGIIAGRGLGMLTS